MCMYVVGMIKKLECKITKIIKKHSGTVEDLQKKVVYEIRRFEIKTGRVVKEIILDMDGIGGIADTQIVLVEQNDFIFPIRMSFN